MKAFVIMPFAPRLAPIYSAIQQACSIAGITSVRADEVLGPGPIVNQIFDNLADADLAIAEVTDRNPNVYYEVGVAHSLGKPTILLARRDSISDLPFDISHNRVIAYAETDVPVLVNSLASHLCYIRTSLVDASQAQNLGNLLANLSPTSEPSNILIGELIRQISSEFNLIDAHLLEEKSLSRGEFLIVIGDAFGNKVTLNIDVNGIITRKKLL